MTQGHGLQRDREALRGKSREERSQLGETQNPSHLQTSVSFPDPNFSTTLLSDNSSVRHHRLYLITTPTPTHTLLTIKVSPVAYDNRLYVELKKWYK